jgi:hypothetical protein
VTVATLAGKNYVLEFKDAVTEAFWGELPPINGDGTEKILTDPSAVSPHRFYRVRVD